MTTLTKTPIDAAIEYQPRTRGGRQRSDIDGGGSIAHALPVSEQGYGFTPALCGITPGRRSIGWSSWVSPAVTCPRCRRKLAPTKSPIDEMVERMIASWTREWEQDAPRRQQLWEMRMSIERGIYAEVMGAA